MSLPSKEAVETTKTVVIFVLITAIIAFVGGMRYQSREQAQVRSAVAEATSKN